ncbi:hypothetical protein CC86DRAFT_277466 [Ophiobolus disseminans]|uniref:Zn(2)-C6 fungal-type domain-containing protein n=1 Tax=Ophiobolus disseminans TaxID=1469910 RepID=A0A6A7AIC2_9PLEO|nr:hypothetical protein CC86DRAFT_277466 [Ophiobolus disseminans]
MSQDPFVSIRTTQRVPRSCTSCSSRKVRCDKSIPCDTCIRRGQPEACVRELVIVRGEMTTYRDAPHVPTYEELNSENERLRQEVEALKAQIFGSSSILSSHDLAGHTMDPLLRKRQIDQDEEGLEQKLWDSLASVLPATKPVVSSWDDIVLPTRSCSEFLVDYDEKWNSWVHYALEYPHFRVECDGFMTAMANGIPIEYADISWMAVYFSVMSAALLMMDDDEAEKLTLHEPFEHQVLSQIWYNTAIFCLHRTDFMRVPNIRCVQAIAILGICFNNFGDSDLGQHMWSCALRIAQRIGLDTPYSELAGKHLGEESQHRLWWTLVICEWLSLPCHPPAVDELDFDVPYPQAPLPPPSTVAGSNHEHPVHYHIFMARTANVWHRFLKAVRLGHETIEDKVRIVRAVDEELAAIINTLPPHLQPDMDSGDDEEQLHHVRSKESWVTWQRFDLTLVLLHLRIRVNRTLQEQWLSTSNPNRPDWARTVSVSSSVSIIWINSNWGQPASMRKQWALSYHIFTAAILLLREFDDSERNQDEGHREVICTAIEMLDQVKSRNALAHHASLILRERLDSIRLV